MKSERLEWIEIMTQDLKRTRVPWRLAMELRGRLIGGGYPEFEERFAAVGASRPVVLSEADTTSIPAICESWAASQRAAGRAS